MNKKPMTPEELADAVYMEEDRNHVLHLIRQRDEQILKDHLRIGSPEMDLLIQAHIETDEELIEGLAKWLFSCDEKRGECDFIDWEDLTKSQEKEYLDEARAAIKKAREKR
jgi:hypothetical protein